MKTKTFGLDVKDVSGEGTFEGYASTFGGAPDSYGDVISPGAFAESLVKHKREGTMPLMLFGHDHTDLPIGIWTDMAEDGRGLWAKGELDLEDPFSARVYRALKQRRMRGLSIGYEVRKSRPDDKRPGVTFLDAIDLWEVSVVNFPANRRSLVDAVKSDEEFQRLRQKLVAGDRLTEREFEGLLKAEPFGLTNSQAERAVRVNLKRGQGDPDDTARTAGEALRALREAVAGFRT
jgi:HK97 family phage prohead protease